MNVIQRLTLRHMAQNKKRTLVTVLGTIVSVTMVTAVAIIALSFLDKMQKNTVQNIGLWHTAYERVPVKEAAVITEDENTASYSLSYQGQYAQLPESKDPRQYLCVGRYAPGSLKHLPLRMTQGRAPERTDELVVSQDFLDTSGYEWKVGDRVTLTVGALYVPYTQEDGSEGRRYVTQQDAQDEETLWEPAGEQTFTVVGIAAMRTNMETSWMYGYTGISGLDLAALPADATVDIRVENSHLSRQLFRDGARIAEQLSCAVSFNSSLLMYSGVMEDTYLMTTLTTTVVTLCLVILIGSVSLIYNAFAISLSERSRTLGMLASVGATRQQKRASVFFEASVIGAAAIPLGILFGWLGIRVTFLAVGPMLDSLMGDGPAMQVVMNPWVAVFAALFSALVLFISAWVPARRASKMGPIDAIRGNGEQKLRARQVKTSRLTGKLFGFEAELGLKNMKRSKNRYRATLLSLVVSVVLFLTAATFTDYMQTAFAMTQDQVQYDLLVNISGTDEEQEQLAAAVEQVEGADRIDRYTVLQGALWTQLDESQLHPDFKKYAPKGSTASCPNIQVFGLPEDQLRDYCRRAGIGRGALETGSGIAIAPLNLKQEHNFTAVRQLKDPAGTVLYLHRESGADSASTPLMLVGESSEKTEVMAGYEEVLTDLYVVTSEETVRQIAAALPEVDLGTQMTVRAVNPVQVYNQIMQMPAAKTGAMRVMNISDYGEQNRQVMGILSVFIYGFIALITLVCAANIFNTISTGVALRAREFAMLRSVGMTPRGLTKMVRCESLFYGVKALAYGMPMAVLVALGMYKALERNFDFGFMLPWTAYLGAAAGVFLLVGSTMLYATGKMRRANLVDALKDENL
ncbi:ABC transporter permease [Neobittarella massiliensis]|uniref:ABC transporter permease n=1 Tax=Neobittarella massiliensis (ex Bilen et al. 2018) TaxID=2041842 RepID=UPI000CF742E5|nr:ABC transporter permease [Neobittarella massiliensis]